MCCLTSVSSIYSLLFVDVIMYIITDNGRIYKNAFMYVYQMIDGPAAAVSSRGGE